MPESSVRTQTSMPAARTCSTAPMWSQWRWVSSTEVTPNCVATRSNRSCSLAASISVASPVLRHRTTYTLFWMGPTTKRCTSAAASDQTSSTLSIPQDCHAGGVQSFAILAMEPELLAGRGSRDRDELWLQRGAGRAPQDGQALLGREVARDRGTSSDGDRTGLRSRRLETDGERARPAGPRHPRRVRRPGLWAGRALRGL